MTDVAISALSVATETYRYIYSVAIQNKLVVKIELPGKLSALIGQFYCGASYQKSMYAKRLP